MSNGLALLIIAFGTFAICATALVTTGNVIWLPSTIVAAGTTIILLALGRR